MCNALWDIIKTPNLTTRNTEEELHIKDIKYFQHNHNTVFPKSRKKEANLGIKSIQNTKKLQKRNSSHHVISKHWMNIQGKKVYGKPKERMTKLHVNEAYQNSWVFMKTFKRGLEIIYIFQIWKNCSC